MGKLLFNTLLSEKKFRPVAITRTIFCSPSRKSVFISSRLTSRLLFNRVPSKSVITIFQSKSVILKVYCFGIKVCFIIIVISHFGIKFSLPLLRKISFRQIYMNKRINSNNIVFLSEISSSISVIRHVLFFW